MGQHPYDQLEEIQQLITEIGKQLAKNKTKQKTLKEHLTTQQDSKCCYFTGICQVSSFFQHFKQFNHVKDGTPWIILNEKWLERCPGTRLEYKRLQQFPNGTER